MTDYNWVPDEETGWIHVYNKDEKATLHGPPETFIAATMSRANGNFKYRLMWRDGSGGGDGTATDNGPADGGGIAEHWSDSNIETPPTGLVGAGNGADPGLFDVDSTTGTISVLPRRNGNFSLYLLVVDMAGAAVGVGLPAELDQVVVKRWDFSVVGKPDFNVISYARKTKDLPKVAGGEAPFITSAKVGLVDCTVGTIYHFAPIDPAALVYEYASGGDEAQIRFTIRNPPPGFFIDPDTGELQGNPQPTGDDDSEIITYKTDFLAVDPSGQIACRTTGCGC